MKGSESLCPAFSRCGKRREDKCLTNRDGCYGCAESGHMKNDCLKENSTIREGKQINTSGSDDGTQKKNRFYASQSRKGQD